MRFSHLTCITALLTLQPAVSLSASFDCSKAITPAEKSICANPDLGRLDQEIAAAYKELLAKADDPFKKYVQEAQRAWLKSRSDPQTLAATMQTRLQALHNSFYHVNGLTFLRLMRQRGALCAGDAGSERGRLGQGCGDERPMFLLTKLPGTDLYNQWAIKEWQEAPDVYTPEEYEKARIACNQGDCTEVVTQYYEVKFASPEMLSVYEAISEDSFGTHPATSNKNYNWWLSRAGEIKTSDIFTNKRYVEIITRALTKYFTENFDGQRDQGNSVEIALNPNNWAITAQSLHISGQGDDFRLGRGFEEIDIPWKDFGDGVAPHFIDISKDIP